MKTYARPLTAGGLPNRPWRREKTRATERPRVNPLTMRKTPATAATRAAWSFGRTSSPRLESLAESGQVFGVGIEVFVHGRELPVQPSNDPGLQILRM